MRSGPSPASKEKLKSWLRYYEDLGIQTFYRDRAPRQASPQQASTDKSVMTTPEKGTADTAVAKPAQPSQIRAATPKVNLVARGPSLFEAADRVEGDSLERICGELAGCTRCKLHRR